MSAEIKLAIIIAIVFGALYAVDYELTQTGIEWCKEHPLGPC